MELKMQHDDIVSKYPPSMENALLILHELQGKNPQNYLTEHDLTWVVGYLDVPCSQIYGLATYYTLFSLRPRGRHILRVCRSPVCRMLGSDRVIDQVKRILGVNLGDTTRDGLFTLEPTECIGQCDRAPCMSVDHAIYGKTRLKKIGDLLTIYKKFE
jgi:NADH-quinone oxidoreductase subunit E